MKPWKKVILIVKSAEKILIYVRKQKSFQKKSKKKN